MCSWASQKFILPGGRFSLVIRLILGTCGDLLVKMVCPCFKGPRGPECQAEQFGAAPDRSRCSCLHGKVSLPGGIRLTQKEAFPFFSLKGRITQVLLAALTLEGKPLCRGAERSALRQFPFCCLRFLILAVWFSFSHSNKTPFKSSSSYI